MIATERTWSRANRKPPAVAQAKRLLALARSSRHRYGALADGAPDGPANSSIEWIEAFPESDHGPVWLKAFEAGLSRPSVKADAGCSSRNTKQNQVAFPARPYSQSVYCIDVRSEPFRRHLESIGPTRDVRIRRIFRRIHSLSGLGKGA